MKYVSRVISFLVFLIVVCGAGMEPSWDAFQKLMYVWVGMGIVFILDAHALLYDIRDELREAKSAKMEAAEMNLVKSSSKTL